MPSTPPNTFDVDVNLLFKVPQDVVAGHIHFPIGHCTLLRGEDIRIPISQLRVNNRSSEFDVAFFLGSHGHAFTNFLDIDMQWASLQSTNPRLLTLVISSANDIPEHSFLFWNIIYSIGIKRSRIEVESFSGAPQVSACSRLIVE